MPRQTYTEKLHARRLLQMLEREDICRCCPASRGFDAGNSAGELWKSDPGPCGVCRKFLKMHHSDIRNCPCNFFENPREVTVKKLKSKGYL